MKHVTKQKYPYFNGSSKHTSAITHLNLHLNLDLMFTFCIQRLGRGLIVTKIKKMFKTDTAIWVMAISIV